MNRFLSQTCAKLQFSSISGSRLLDSGIQAFAWYSTVARLLKNRATCLFCSFSPIFTCQVSPEPVFVTETPSGNTFNFGESLTLSHPNPEFCCRGITRGIDFDPTPMFPTGRFILTLFKLLLFNNSSPKIFFDKNTTDGPDVGVTRSTSRMRLPVAVMEHAAYIFFPRGAKLSNATPWVLPFTKYCKNTNKPKFSRLEFGNFSKNSKTSIVFLSALARQVIKSPGLTPYFVPYGVDFPTLKHFPPVPPMYAHECWDPNLFSLDRIFQEMEHSYWNFGSLVQKEAP